ncbi:MAG: RsmE family RNA methyltransferase [Deltaproteobacteria bacterium]
MNRFTVDKKDISGDAVVISEPQDVHHLTRVLRVHPGEDVFISDGAGAGYVTTLVSAGRAEAHLAVKERLPVRRREEERLRLTLACAVPKASHFEDIIDKGTQLGVEAFVPLVTQRSLVDEAACLRKMPRWERVRRAAARQSGVLFLPELAAPVAFTDFLPRLASFDLKILPHLAAQTRSLADACDGFARGRVAVLIGPEGDFSPAEVRAALDAGCRGACLGCSVLRVDTAAIAVASYLRLRFDT